MPSASGSEEASDASSSRGMAPAIAAPVGWAFLPDDADIAGLTVAQYLARLAAEATTVINAEDYGRTVHDLFLRRQLIEYL